MARDDREFRIQHPLVTARSGTSPDAFSMSRSKQVEHLSSLSDVDISIACAVDDRNYVKSDLSETLRKHLKNLSGR